MANTPSPSPDLTPGAAASGDVPASIQLAMTRLQQSRRRLRQAMMPPPPSRLAGADRSRLLASLPDKIGAMLRRIRVSMGSWPWLDVAAATLQSWWQRYPWRPVGELVFDEIGAQLRPAVQRRPFAAALIAAGVGALIVTARPWRWSVVRWPARRLPRHAAHWVGRQVAQPALQTALVGLLVHALRPDADASSARPASAATPTGGRR